MVSCTPLLTHLNVSVLDITITRDERGLWPTSKKMVGSGAHWVHFVWLEEQGGRRLLAAQ